MGEADQRQETSSEEMIADGVPTPIGCGGGPSGPPARRKETEQAAAIDKLPC
jgi:hypothetical protein